MVTTVCMQGFCTDAVIIVMFLVYINDETQDVRSDNYSNLLADTIKTCRPISNLESCKQFMKAIDELFQTWKIK